MKTIPKLITRIWLGEEYGGKPMPKEYEEYWEKWKLLHPKWEFITYNSPTKEVAEAVAAQTNIAAKVDLIKPFTIDKGGFYTDCDVEPFSSIEHMRYTDKQLLLPWSGHFFNFFMGAPKNSAIITAAKYRFQNKTENIPIGNISNDIGSQYYNWYGKTIHPIRSREINPFAAKHDKSNLGLVAKHYGTQSWRE